MYKLETTISAVFQGNNDMDGDPKDDKLNAGGLNQTDSIPGLGGKTKADIEIASGSVTLDNMDADLTSAVQSGDETHVRARLGGDHKLSEAEALILIRTQEVEERQAYNARQAQETETADVHRREDNDSIFATHHANRDWQGQGQVYRGGNSNFASMHSGHNLSADSFTYDREGGRTDRVYGFHQTHDGTITTKRGDVFNAKTNTYKLANGQTGHTLTPELQTEAKRDHVSKADASAAVVRTAEAIAHAAAGALSGVVGGTTPNGDRTTGGDDPPLTRREIKAAQRIVKAEMRNGTLGQTAEELQTGYVSPMAAAAIAASRGASNFMNSASPSPDSQFVASTDAPAARTAATTDDAPQSLPRAVMKPPVA